MFDTFDEASFWFRIKKTKILVNFSQFYKHRGKILGLICILIPLSFVHIHRYSPEYCTGKGSSSKSRILSIREKISRQLCHNITLPLPKQKLSFPRTTNHSDCSLPYITINEKGGLGNKICQYLSLLYLKQLFDVRIAAHIKMNQALSTRFKDLSIPLIDSECHHPPSVNFTYIQVFRQLSKDAAAGYNPQTRLKQSIFIADYPCPPDLLSTFRNDVKSHLQILDEVKNISNAMLHSSLCRSSFDNRNKTLISVHVRRTDYSRHMNEGFKRNLLTPCYYFNAFSYYRERFNNNVLFVVYSDDLKWCRRYLSAPDVIIGGSEETLDPFFDFVMLSSFDYHIRGLGTFGFLSALFGNGPITFPLVDNLNQSDMEIGYICSSSEDFIPRLDEPY